MAESEADPLVIGVPERLGRRMRLGPFPSSRDALKFVTYAATGALLAPFTSPWLWLPFVLAGFAISVWRPDGKAIDERVLAFGRWKLRSWDIGWSMKGPAARLLVRQGLLEVAPHRYVAVVRTAGSPMAYLPPDELTRRFELYRDLLRSTGGSFSVTSSVAPIRAQSVRPTGATAEGAEGSARSGYSELVLLLCRRRLLRRVFIVLGTTGGDTNSVARLEGQVSNLIDRLSALGLRPTRLRDRSLAEAARRFGWPAEVTRS